MTEPLVQAINQQVATVKTNLGRVLAAASDYEHKIDGVTIEQAKFACMGIGETLYGKGSLQVKQFIDAKKANEDNFFSKRHLAEALLGFLNNIETELNLGLVESIREAAQGEVLADFLLLAKDLEPTSNKNVCAVLAAAALEDTLKKIAAKVNLGATDGKDMTDIVNLLKSNGFFSGPQGPIVTGYVKLRNKAFHAEWDKFESAEVVSMIAFTEMLIMKHLEGK